MKGLTREFRFWHKVPVSPPFSDCWEWRGSRHGQGYGFLQTGPRHELSHRVSYEINIGSIPEGMDVLHRCDNPPCVNPAHLFLGTHRDNIRDAETKHRIRHPRGEKHGMAKLTDAQVGEIRRRLDVRKHGDQTDVAREFGVSDTTISAIVHGKTRLAQ